MCLVPDRIPYSVQAAFVHTEEEAPDFERHLSHALGIFDSSLNPQSILEEPIDLCAEPSSASSAAACAFASPKPGWSPNDDAMEVDKVQKKAPPNVGRALEVTPFKFFAASIFREATCWEARAA